ncbi:MAG: translation initiation factor IF-2 [Acidobacteriota bacterium]
MDKVRIYQLVKKLKVDEELIFDILADLGISVKSDMEPVNADVAREIKDQITEIKKIEKERLKKEMAKAKKKEREAKAAEKRRLALEKKKAARKKEEVPAEVPVIAVEAEEEVMAESRKVAAEVKPEAKVVEIKRAIKPEKKVAEKPKAIGAKIYKAQKAKVKPVEVKPMPPATPAVPIKRRLKPVAIIRGEAKEVREAKEKEREVRSASLEALRLPTPSRPKPIKPKEKISVAPPPLKIVKPPIEEAPPVVRDIMLTEGVTVKELAEKTGIKSKDIIKKIMGKGLFVTINQPLDNEMAKWVSSEFHFNPTIISFEEEAVQQDLEEIKGENLVPRDPVVTIMGHVDHGKTSLLDAIRESNIIATEHGGITQKLGAYHVDIKGRKIVFLDTPGHEAFTMMRARGARVTDIVVLVVAADDGVKPQTLEAINHARAADVPIVVAINKIDKPEANPDRVKKQLAEHDILIEEWGGKIVCVEVSAKQRKNLDLLLEMILLVADMAELKADPNRIAAGTVLEARLDKTKGPVATVLVQNGTLKDGDPFIVGVINGKVRAMFDDRGNRVRKAGPSTPVEVLGLEGPPKAGDKFQVIAEEWRARQIGSYRQSKLREERLAKSSRLTLEDLHQKIAEGTVKELPLILKADTQGSIEVLAKTIADLSTEKIKIRTIHSAPGAITETDVLLASASNAIIIGFSVRPERSAADLAEKEKVDIRLHTVIYNITNEIKNAMAGLLEPTFREVYLGRAEVKETFRISKVGTIAGCAVIDGKILRSADVRLLRDNIVIYEGKITSLKRFKDDASEVKSGLECGIGIEKFNDIKIGDQIEAFRMEKVIEKSI